MIEIPNPATASKRFLQGLFIGGYFAKINMVITAPSAGAARIKPSPSAPTFKISCAKIGISATAPPKNTENMSRLNAPRIILLLKTN